MTLELLGWTGVCCLAVATVFLVRAVVGALREFKDDLDEPGDWPW